MPAQPRCCATVSRHGPVRIGDAQLMEQEIPEEVVVAVPVPLVVQRDDERVRVLHLPQQVGRSARARDRVTELRAQPVEDGGGQQEVVDLGGLPVQDLRRQVVDDVAIVAGEGGDEVVGVVASPQREGGHVQAGRPPLGPVDEPGHVDGIEFQPVVLVEQVGRLGDREPEVGDGDLAQVPSGPMPGDVEGRLDPGGDHQLEPGRRMVQQEGHRLVHLGARDQVVVVDHQRGPTGQRDHLVDELRAALPRRGSSPGVTRSSRRSLSDRRGDRPQRLDHVQEEADRVVVTPVQRDPGERSDAPPPQRPTPTAGSTCPSPPERG